jgi:hypothetical protein
VSAPITPQSIDAMQCCAWLCLTVFRVRVRPNVVVCPRCSGDGKTVPTQLSLTAVCSYGRNILLYRWTCQDYASTFTRFVM